MEKQFPKNVRQIGNVCDEPKIYVEDYVDTYLNQLRQKATESPVGAVFTGEIVCQEGQDVAYISGALQIKDLEVNGNDIIIREEAWEKIEEEKKEYFPDQEMIGWCLVETGHPMGLNKGVNKVHNKFFAKENTIFIWRDALEADEIFYAFKYGELMQMGGHYIYYEKNPAMQNYMINTRRTIGVTPSEMVEDRAAKNFRNTVREKIEYKEQRQSSRFVYAMSVLLVVVVLAIGVSTINNFDKMEAVQATLETMSVAMSASNEEKSGGEAETAGEPAESSEISADAEDEGEAQEADVQDDESQGDGGTETEASGGQAQEVSDASYGLSEEDFYIVKKGDTLDIISEKMYGDIGHVEAICKMNGLSDGNLIFIGQKLLLP